MEMTIDDCISKLTEILEDATEDENSVCYVTVMDEPTLKTAIDVMHKYQKIEEIFKNWFYTYFNATDAMNKLGEVLVLEDAETD